VRPAAVFDLDGTLVRGTSVERLLVPWLVRRGVIGARQLTGAALVAASYPFLGRTRALRRNKRWISGVEVAAVEAHMEVFLDEAVAPRWRRPVVTRMEELRTSGHALFLLSGAPDFVVRAVGDHLRVDGVTATPMEIVGGRFTGRLAGAHVFGSQKLTALRRLAEEHDPPDRRSAGMGAGGGRLEGLGVPIRGIARSAIPAPLMATNSSPRGALRITTGQPAMVNTLCVGGLKWVRMASAFSPRARPDSSGAASGRSLL
jgi:HAD superfamily phosphoserine phosphatase-like hydrolase